MKLTDLKVIIGLCLLIGGAGFTAAKTFATTDDLLLIAAKAAVGIEATIERLMKEKVLLESKPNKSAYDLVRIKYLNEELERIKKLNRL